MSYKKGDVVVVKFPFVPKEGTAVIQKGRPAFVISEDKIKRRYKDVVLAAITSHIPRDIMELEIVLEPAKSERFSEEIVTQTGFHHDCPGKVN